MIQTINLGQAANDGTGEPLRQGGQKINANFAELDTRVTTAQTRADKGVTDAATAQAKANAAIPATQRGVANGVASLGADGKLPVSQLPPLAVNEVFTVASQAAMLALTAERGDAAIRTDQNGQWYILTTDVPSTLANWKPINQNLGVALTALGALTPAADTLPYFNGTATASTTSFTPKARTVLAFTTNAQWQSELGLVPVSSTTDNTAGRLVTVGFNGLGGPLLGVQGTPAAQIARNAGATFSYLSANDKPGPAVADGALMTLGANADYAFQFACDWRTGYVYTQYKAGGALSGWIPQYNAVNSLLDPQTAGGLMSMTTVSGFTVFKYANGQMMVQGPIPITPTIGASSQFTVSVAIPVTLVGFVTLIATLYPSVGNDFAIRNTQAPGSTAFIFCANGVSAQTFSGNLTLFGRWK